MLGLIFFIVGLVLLVYLVLELGPHKVLFVIVGLKWNFLWITLIYFVSEMFRAGALWKSLRQRPRQPYSKMLGIQLSGEAMGYLSFTGPFVGCPLRAWLLRKAGLNGPAAFAAVVAEYLVYTFVSAVMSI